MSFNKTLMYRCKNGVTKDSYEVKIKEYDTELEIIEDLIKSID